MTEITSRPFGAGATKFTLSNSAGLSIDLTDYGASIVAIRVPDRQGRAADVALGYDTAEGYAGGGAYFGCTVGRYGNRIAKGRFEIDGQVHQLAVNNGENHLHGGVGGFGRHLWQVREVAGGVAFSRTSPDGEDSYPGNLEVEVQMTLNEANELVLEYAATTDAATHVNLTNHCYFNLAGHAGGSILDHELWLDAELMVPVSAELIPDGSFLPVEGTPFDFRKPTRIGARIEVEHEQLSRAGGYDHCFVPKGKDRGLRLIAGLAESSSGRFMEVLSTEPGVQFYSGNFLDGTERGKGGAVYGYRGGLCLETQHHPDTPNQPAFPSTLLRPGQTYQSTTIYRFGAR